MLKRGNKVALTAVLAAVVLVALCFIILSVYWAQPVPLVCNPDAVMADSVRIQYRDPATGRLAPFEDFDANEVIAYLNTCSMRFTKKLLNHNFQVGISEIEIFLSEINSSRTRFINIYLGENNMVLDGSVLYEVVDGEAVLAELKNILGL